MTARQQIARLLPPALLLVLVLIGLRGAVPAPRWNGPLKGHGVAIGIALEVILAAALVLALVRDAAARRAAAPPPAGGGDGFGLQPAQALRFVLKYVLAAGMIGIAVVLLTNLHLHFLTKGKPAPAPTYTYPSSRPSGRLAGGGSGGLHIPVGPILYGLLVAAIVAAVAVSIWWSTRLRRPARVVEITDTTAEELRDAVAEGRAALALADDARAAIIACYLAMERSLADRGTARAVADTPDELLARAAAAGTVRGRAAGRLTALFYEARFSTHPLGAGQRAAAAAALDELAAELARAAAAEVAAAELAAAERAARAAREDQPS